MTAEEDQRRALAPEDEARFRDLVREVSGTAIPEYRRRDLERAVGRAREDTGCPDNETLYRHLTAGFTGRAALETLIGALTIGETYFFRNRAQFHALEHHVLPSLIARRRTERRLRLWSAACASGEEPYSLAILLRRLLPDIAEWDVLIQATDIKREGLEIARRGTYPPWSFRGVPTPTREAWFVQRKDGLQVHPEVRDSVSFEYLNLVEDDYPSPGTNTHDMDLILCRNVLMYFEPETARRVVARLQAALVEGGWLVVGHTEPSQDLFRDFEVHNFPGTVMSRQSQASVQTAAGVRPPLHRTTARGAPRRRPFFHGPPVQATERTSAPHGTAGSPARGTTAAGAADVSRLEALAMADPGDAESAYRLAKLHADRMELDAAERWVGVALQRAPLHARSHYLRGLMLQEKGREKAALDAYRRTVYADPEFVLGHLSLAEVLRRSRQRDRARKRLATVVRLLRGRPRGDPVPGGDGLTVGELLQLAQMHRASLGEDPMEPEGDG